MTNPNTSSTCILKCNANIDIASGLQCVARPVGVQSSAIVLDEWMTPYGHGDDRGYRIARLHYGEDPLVTPDIGYGWNHGTPGMGVQVHLGKSSNYM